MTADVLPERATEQQAPAEPKPGGPGQGATGARRAMEALLRLPLIQKLLLADILVNITAFAVMGNTPRTAEDGLGIMALALLVTVIVNGVLVYWSLLPLRSLESTAVKVTRGD